MPIVGAHGRGGHKEAPGRLELFDFDTLRTEPLSEKVERFALAHDHLTLVVRDGKRLRAIPRQPQARPARSARRSRTRRRARADGSTSTACAPSVEPRAEWRQMLREVWRLQRDHFWTPDMSGVDWNAVYDSYAPLLERVATRGELSDLIWEMQGELGTSHAYEMGGDHRKPPAWPLGHLGAEFKLAEDGASYEIASIVAGDPVGCRRRFAAERDRRGGEGRRAHRRGERPAGVARRPPQALLVHQANAKVELTLARRERPRARSSRRPSRRSAGALSRVGRAQPRVGARAIRTAASATSTCRTCCPPASRNSIATSAPSATAMR